MRVHLRDNRLFEASGETTDSMNGNRKGGLTPSSEKKKQLPQWIEQRNEFVIYQHPHFLFVLFLIVVPVFGLSNSEFRLAMIDQRILRMMS